MRTPRERRRPRRAEERRRARTVGASPSGRRRGRRCARVHRPWSTTGTAERLRWSLSSRARLVAEPRTLFGPDTQFRPAGRLGSGQLGSWQAGLKLNCSTQINSTRCNKNNLCNQIKCSVASPAVSRFQDYRVPYLGTSSSARGWRDFTPRSFSIHTRPDAAATPAFSRLRLRSATTMRPYARRLRYPWYAHTVTKT